MFSSGLFLQIRFRQYPFPNQSLIFFHKQEEERIIGMRMSRMWDSHGGREQEGWDTDNADEHGYLKQKEDGIGRIGNRMCRRIGILTFGGRQGKDL